MYISKDNINANEIYTSIYVTAKTTEQTASTKYEDYIEQIKNNIEEIKSEREQARRNQLVELSGRRIVATLIG